MQRCQLLRDVPLMGAPRDYLAPGLRVIFHRAYAIYYLLDKFDGADVTVLRVLHGARDVAAIAEKGGFDS